MIAPEGRTLVFTNATKRRIRVHDAVTGKILWELGDDHMPMRFAPPKFHDGGRSVLLRTLDPIQCVFCDARSGRLQKRMEFEKNTGLSVLGVSPHGDFAVARDNISILVSQLGNDAGIYGAGYLAKDGISR